MVCWALWATNLQQNLSTWFWIFWLRVSKVWKLSSNFWNNTGRCILFEKNQSIVNTSLCRTLVTSLTSNASKTYLKTWLKLKKKTKNSWRENNEALQRFVNAIYKSARPLWSAEASLGACCAWHRWWTAERPWWRLCNALNVCDVMLNASVQDVSAHLANFGQTIGFGVRSIVTTL